MLGHDPTLLLSTLPRPERAWFIRPDGHDASGPIHGVGHTRRVMIHAVEIAEAIDLLVLAVEQLLQLRGGGAAAQRFGEMRDLQTQVERLNEALETRKLVARAKGALMERHGWGEQEAHRHLQKEASRLNMKLADLARAMLAVEAMEGGQAREE